MRKDVSRYIFWHHSENIFQNWHQYLGSLSQIHLASALWYTPVLSNSVLMILVSDHEKRCMVGLKFARAAKIVLCARVRKVTEMGLLLEQC